MRFSEYPFLYSGKCRLSMEDFRTSPYFKPFEEGLDGENWKSDCFMFLVYINQTSVPQNVAQFVYFFRLLVYFKWTYLRSGRDQWLKVKSRLMHSMKWRLVKFLKRGFTYWHNTFFNRENVCDEERTPSDQHIFQGWSCWVLYIFPEELNIFSKLRA